MKENIEIKMMIMIITSCTVRYAFYLRSDDVKSHIRIESVIIDKICSY